MQFIVRPVHEIGLIVDHDSQLCQWRFGKFQAHPEYKCFIGKYKWLYFGIFI